MTTIVYDHKNKQIACDSLLTMDGIVIDSEAIKYKTKDGKLWFIAGSPGDADTFIQHYEPLTGANKNLNVDTIFVIKEGECKDGVYMAIHDEGNIYKECVLDYNYATGSGFKWALAALDHGKTAKQAIEYAITKCIYTGGKVHVYDIEKAKFL